jgi:hypothetical protein
MAVGCAKEMKKLPRAYFLLLALALLALPSGCLGGDNESPKAIELWLSHYKAGDPADPLLNDPKLHSCPRFDYPDQPWDQSRTDYFLPTGNVIVCTTTLKDDRSQSYREVLSQARFSFQNQRLSQNVLKSTMMLWRLAFPLAKEKFIQNQIRALPARRFHDAPIRLTNYSQCPG